MEWLCQDIIGDLKFGHLTNKELRRMDLDSTFSFGKYYPAMVPLSYNAKLEESLAQSQKAMDSLITKMKEVSEKEKVAHAQAMNNLEEKYENPEYSDLSRLYSHYSELMKKYELHTALINRFDNHILFQIFKYLRPTDINNCALVCGKFYFFLQQFYCLLYSPSPLFFEECARYKCKPSFRLRKFFHIQQPSLLLSALLLTQDYDPKDEKSLTMEKFDIFDTVMLKLAEEYLQTLFERKVRFHLLNPDLSIFRSDTVKRNFKIFENLDPVEVDLFFATAVPQHKQFGIEVIEPEIISLTDNPIPICVLVTIPIKCKHKTYFFNYRSI